MLKTTRSKPTQAGTHYSFRYLPKVEVAGFHPWPSRAPFFAPPVRLRARRAIEVSDRTIRTKS